MQRPLQISFRNMDPSPVVEQRIREKAARLEQFHDRIVGCQVTVEAPRRHQRKGKLYNVRIVLSVPGRDVIIGNVGPLNHAHEDVLVAVRDAFDAARRVLEDHVRHMRGDEKTHAVPLHGKVARKFDDYGFVEMPDHLEVYFHRNSVSDGGFDRLGVGNEVRLVIAEKEGTEGPQASTVTPIGKHHIVER